MTCAMRIKDFYDNSRQRLLDAPLEGVLHPSSPNKQSLGEGFDLKFFRIKRENIKEPHVESDKTVFKILKLFYNCLNHYRKYVEPYIYV